MGTYISQLAFCTDMCIYALSYRYFIDWRHWLWNGGVEIAVLFSCFKVYVWLEAWVLWMYLNTLKLEVPMFQKMFTKIIFEQTKWSWKKPSINDPSIDFIFIQWKLAKVAIKNEN